MVLGFLIFAGLGTQGPSDRVREDGSLELDAAELEVRDDFVAFGEEQLVESVPELDERVMVLGREERLTLFDAKVVDTAERVTELLLAILEIVVELLVS